MGDGTNPAEQQSASITAQQAADQQQAYNNEQGILNQYQGPVTESPIYKSLLTNGIQSTTHSYDNARAAEAQAANAAGFGYAQPVAQGANAEEMQSEAAALANVPRDAEQQAAGLQLQAAGLQGQDQQQISPDSANQTTNQAYIGQEQANNSLWSSIAQAGMGLISPISI